MGERRKTEQCKSVLEPDYRRPGTHDAETRSNVSLGICQRPLKPPYQRLSRDAARSCTSSTRREGPRCMIHAATETAAAMDSQRASHLSISGCRRPDFSALPPRLDADHRVTARSEMLCLLAQRVERQDHPTLSHWSCRVLVDAEEAYVHKHREATPSQFI